MTATIVRLDVRPILAEKRDPFSEIMAAASHIPAGGTLVVVAPFNPLPLRDVLGRSGFRSEASQAATGEWEVTFCRGESGEGSPTAGDPRFWGMEGDAHVDARGLDEEHAVRIVLAAVGRPGALRKLTVHLDANIDRLYPELLQRGWEATFVPGDAGEVRLEISRVP